MRNIMMFAAAVSLLAACGSGADGDEAVEPNGVSTNTTDDDGSQADSDAGTEIVVSSDAGTDDATDDVTNGDGLRLSTFHEEVFVAEGCTSGYCHGGFALDSPEAVITAFVDVEAAMPTCGRTHYVVPGRPEESILWVRVRPQTAEDLECEVAKMPNGSEGLDEQTAQVIYDWISDGAQL